MKNIVIVSHSPYVFLKHNYKNQISGRTIKYLIANQLNISQKRVHPVYVGREIRDDDFMYSSGYLSFFLTNN